jgi:hypothetical protein
MRTWSRSLILLAATLVLEVGCISEGAVLANLSSYIGTTWANKDYPSGREDIKMVVAQDNVIDLYDSLYSTSPKLNEMITITKSWTDSYGDLWFDAVTTRKRITTPDYTGPKAFELNKISKSGTVWEITSSQTEYPHEMGFSGGGYSIRYRQ